MKAFFLAGSILFSVLILIIAFQNLGGQCSGFMFFFTAISEPFFVALSLSIIGIVTGVFYTGLITSLLRTSSEEEPPGNEW